jgi:hypothetical protein
MEITNFILKTGAGKNTKLDKEYLLFINNVISKQNEQENERWETYNIILKEFLTIDENILKEFKYRVTDGDNPNEVILNTFDKYSNENLSALSWLLKRRIEEYLEEDFYKRFC